MKYKYNELMDFVHEDPKFEREYIKRLMKHKHQASNRDFMKLAKRKRNNTQFIICLKKEGLKTDQANNASKNLKPRSRTERLRSFAFKTWWSVTFALCS